MLQLRPGAAKVYIYIYVCVCVCVYIYIYIYKRIYNIFFKEESGPYTKRGDLNSTPLEGPLKNVRTWFSTTVEAILGKATRSRGLGLTNAGAAGTA